MEAPAAAGGAGAMTQLLLGTSGASGPAAGASPPARRRSASLALGDGDEGAAASGELRLELRSPGDILTDHVSGSSRRRNTTGGQQLEKKVARAGVDYLAGEGIVLDADKFAAQRDQAKKDRLGDGFAWDTLKDGFCEAAGAAQGKRLGIGHRLAVRRRLSAFGARDGDENAPAQFAGPPLSTAEFAAAWGVPSALQGSAQLTGTQSQTPLAAWPGALVPRGSTSRFGLLSPLPMQPLGDAMATLISAAQQQPQQRRPETQRAPPPARRGRRSAAPALQEPALEEPAPPEEGYVFCSRPECKGKKAILQSGLQQHIRRKHTPKATQMCTSICTDTGLMCKDGPFSADRMTAHLKLRKHATAAEAAAMDCTAAGCSVKETRLDLLHSHIRKLAEQEGSEGAHFPLLATLPRARGGAAGGGGGDGAREAPPGGGDGEQVAPPHDPAEGM